MTKAIPSSTGSIKIPFYYHECEHGKRLVHTWTSPCNVCVNENNPQTTIFVGHVFARIDKEGFLKVQAPLRIR